MFRSYHDRSTGNTADSSEKQRRDAVFQSLYNVVQSFGCRAHFFGRDWLLENAHSRDHGTNLTVNQETRAKPLITESQRFLRHRVTRTKLVRCLKHSGIPLHLDRETTSSKFARSTDRSSDSEFDRISIGGQSKYLERYLPVIGPISLGIISNTRLYRGIRCFVRDLIRHVQ